MRSTPSRRSDPSTAALMCAGGVEEGDAAVDGGADERDALLAGGHGQVALAQAHASVTDGRDLQSLPERSRVHVFSSFEFSCALNACPHVSGSACSSR